MKNFYKAENSKLKCNACARKCQILENQVGYCGVRKNNHGKLETLNYSKFIFLKKEKKKLLVGQIGSNMRLSFDMDWDTSILPYLKSKEIPREEVNKMIQRLGYEYTPQELIRYAKEKKCEEIVFQYNEPLVNIEYLLEISKRNEIKVSIVTTGYFTEEFFKLVEPNLSEINILFYSTFDKFYFKHSRVQLSIIKENIYKLHKRNSNFRIIYTLIDGENDSEKQIEQLCKFISKTSLKTPLVFKKYIPSYRMVDKSITDEEKLKKSKQIALKNGLENVILE